MQTETQTAGTSPADPAPAAVDPAPTTLLTDDVPVSAAPGAQPDATPADAKPDDAKPDDKPQGAPEEYADFTAPEGVAFDADAIAELKAYAKEKNLTQEDAQKLADMGARAAQKVDAHYRDAIAQTQKQWVEASRNDAEFGGDKLDENLAVAKRALDTFGTPELREMLRASGLGNHPEVNRAFYRIGKAISEDRLVPGSTRPSMAVDTTKKLYPSMNS